MASSHSQRSEAKKSRSKIAHLISVKSVKSAATLGFQFKFQGYCLEYGCTLIPTIEVLEELKDIKVDKGIPLLIIAYKKGEQDVDKIFFKNYTLQPSILMALQRCIEDDMKLTILKLEFCNMTSDQIETLANILTINNTVTELSVNGNSNEEQNFHLLLQDTKLLMLSLKCCSIDHTGMAKISKELSKPFETTLLHLNLASNLLFAEGIVHVASFLRINRTLVSLNLADNKIYDEGCLILMQPLQKFALELPEIIIRREIRFKLFKKELELEASTSVENSVDTAKDSNSLQNAKRPSIKSKISSKGSRRASKDKASSRSQDTIKSKKSSGVQSSLKPPSETVVERDIGSHPFVQDSYEEDMDIYCKGNDTIISLCLSYNRLTKEGLIGIIQMLRYQRETYPDDKVISRISLEGNDLVDCEQEQLDFYNLINNIMPDSKKSSITTKKSSSRRSSKLSGPVQR